MVSSTRENLKKERLKKKVEALLFSVGERIPVSKICRLSRASQEEVVEALRDLQDDYTKKDTSLEVIDDGEYWKFSVHDDYQNVVRKVVTQTELSKTVLETLAVIAYKYPIKQSELIKIRTNKAYDHLSELEQTGFISRKKHGRSNLIKLTDKFFAYFDLKEAQLKEQFADFASIAQAIEKKETEIEEAAATKAAEESIEDKEKRIQEEIDALDEKDIGLETYGDPEEKHMKVVDIEPQPEQPVEDVPTPKPVEVYESSASPEPQTINQQVNNEQSKQESSIKESESTNAAEEPQHIEPTGDVKPAEQNNVDSQEVKKENESEGESEQEASLDNSSDTEEQEQTDESAEENTEETQEENSPPDDSSDNESDEEQPLEESETDESTEESGSDEESESTEEQSESEEEGKTPTAKEYIQNQQDEVVETAPKGITVSPEMEEKIDKRINAMMDPDAEQDEESTLNPLLDEDKVRSRRKEDKSKKEDEDDIFSDVQ